MDDGGLPASLRRSRINQAFASFGSTAAGRRTKLAFLPPDPAEA